MRTLKCLLILFLCTFFFNSCRQSDQKFSDAVTNFEKHTKGTNALYFYPGTLKMLNFKKDSSLNALTREIKKVKIVRLSKDSIDHRVVNELTDQIKKEKFVYLLELKQGGYQIMLYLQKKGDKPKEYIAMVYNPKDMTVIDLVGNVPLKFLPALLSGNMKLGGFETVLNTIQNTNKKQSPRPKDGNHTGDK